MDWPPYLFLLEWLLQSLCARGVRTFSSSNEAPLHVACALLGASLRCELGRGCKVAIFWRAPGGANTPWRLQARGERPAPGVAVTQRRLHARDLGRTHAAARLGGGRKLMAKQQLGGGVWFGGEPTKGGQV
jgi:hypothetical protein